MLGEKKGQKLSLGATVWRTLSIGQSCLWNDGGAWVLCFIQFSQQPAKLVLLLFSRYEGRHRDSETLVNLRSYTASTWWG